MSKEISEKSRHEASHSTFVPFGNSNRVVRKEKPADPLERRNLVSVPNSVFSFSASVHKFNDKWSGIAI